MNRMMFGFYDTSPVIPWPIAGLEAVLFFWEERGAISDIGRDVTEEVNKVQRIGSDKKRVNSQFKMGPPPPACSGRPDLNIDTPSRTGL